ncbi:hypothetical protein BV898_17944 [Hypsibius exemplaris]|uniref:Uncharacterized protein n=1 Tax=Hypsibius exemplaris TaxID=2072580 RepID=A0A9X6NIH6_HYPEX|nr:hypothetical protein BV898_17944 [Hypsibius exemplaris]
MDTHLSLNNFLCQRVKFATKLLSRTVAISLRAYGIGDSDATQSFRELFNEVFDNLNSSHFRDAPARRPHTAAD